MAWNISKTKRQALVKLQLRDKDGKFIEMGGGVKWYSSRLKKVVAGTVVGSKGENALVRLNKENPTHEPALVTVPAASIQAIDGKASLSPKGKPTADETPEFDEPEAVADVEADPNAEAESDHESQLKGPQHLAANYGITETSDGNTYITRKDGESIYSPARALKVGDELISPAGADPTKPFSIGRGWATKGTERLNKEGEGPVIGKVIAISENRYAVVQMAGGHTIADRRNPEEQTDTVTVGLSNQVILATMGLKDALGDRVSSQTYAERPSDEEKEVAPDAPEAQSDHEGREVPEDQLEAEGEAAPADRAQVLKNMPVGGRIMTEDESQVFEKRSTNQWAFVSGNGDLITDDAVLGMVERGESNGKRFVAYAPEDENAPESAPEESEAPETQPAPESPAEEAPEAAEEAPEVTEEAPEADTVAEEAPQAKTTPVNDIVEGLAELEQAVEDVDGSGLEDDESEEVLNGASFDVTAADGTRQTVTAEKDENGDWNFVVADENGAEVASHIIGSEDNRVLAEKISNPTTSKASEAAPEATPEAPEAESYNENGLTEQEQRELASYTRLAARSYDQFKDDEGDRYKALADELLARGEERKSSTREAAPESAPITGPTDAEKIANAEKMYGTGSPQHLEAQRRFGTPEAEAPAPAEKDEKAPESAPEPEKAPEPTPEETKPVEDAPAPSLVEPDAAPEKAPAEAPAAAPEETLPGLSDGVQDEIKLPGVRKQSKRDNTKKHLKTLNELEEGDRVSYTNAHDETSTYQKHADGTWDLLDPEDEWEDESPLEEALTADQVAQRHKRGELDVQTVADREQAERDARPARGESYMDRNPDPVRRQNNGNEGQSQTQQAEQDANAADQPWSVAEIQGNMSGWFDFAQAVKNGDTRAIETMSRRKREGDEESFIVTNDKGQPVDVTMTYNEDGDPVVRLSNFDDSSDVYGDFEIDTSVMPRHLSTLIHEAINSDDISAAVTERNGSADRELDAREAADSASDTPSLPLDSPMYIGRMPQLSQDRLANAVAESSDSGIEMNGEDDGYNVTDADKAEATLRPVLEALEKELADYQREPNQSSATLSRLRSSIGDFNDILTDINEARQTQLFRNEHATETEEDARLTERDAEEHQLARDEAAEDAESSTGDPVFSGSAKDLPIGSKVYSDDDLVQMTKHGDNQWTIDTRQGELIDNATVDAFVRHNQTNRGQTFKQSVPGGQTNAPALNGEEGYVPIDGRGMKSKQDAKAASDAKTEPFGISIEWQRDGLDHAIANRPELMTPEETEEFRKLGIELTWAQHNNRTGREATVRGKFNALNRRIQSRLDQEAMARHKNDGPSEDSVEESSADNKAPENAPEVPVVEAPETAPVVNPEANEDGLLPDEAARLADLENRQAAAFRGESDEDPASFDQEISELIRHGRLRGRGREVGPFRASNPVPARESEQESAPEPKPEPAPEPEASAARRTRNSEPVPVADADGNMITRGDKIGHPTLGPVEITNTIPGTGRIEFIDPTTGRKKSVKAARVRKIDPNAVTEEQPTTAEPGSQFIDAATGKQGFGDKNGNRVLVGDRVRDANGNTGTVKSVYTAASGGAWIPVQWDSDGKTRRSMGNVLEADNSETPEATPEAAPEPIEVVRPSATRAPAPDRVEPVEEPFEPVRPSTQAPEAPTQQIAERTEILSALHPGSAVSAGSGAIFTKGDNGLWTMEGNPIEYSDANLSGLSTLGDGMLQIITAARRATPEVESDSAAMARTEKMAADTPINGMIVSSDGSQKFYKIREMEFQFNEGTLLTPIAVARMIRLGEARGMSFDIAPEGRPASVNTTPVVDVPTTPAATDPVGPEGADTPGRRAQLRNRLRSMPIGTKVESRGGEQIFTKEGEDNWSSNVDPGSVLNAEDISGLLLSGNARGLRYQTTPPPTLEPKLGDGPTVLPTVTLANPQGSEPAGDSITELTGLERLHAIRDAPLGAVLKSPNDSNVFTKIDRRLFVDQDGTEIEDMSQLTSVTGQNGPWTITAPTVPYVARFEPNTPLPGSSAGLKALITNAPVGSVINNSERPVSGYVKTGPNTWDSIDSGVEFSGGSVALIVDGYDGYNISPPAPKPIPQDLESRQRVSEMAPIGTVVTSDLGESYTKISDTLWADTATGDFKYHLGEFTTKLVNNPYTGNYFVTGFHVPDIAPEPTVTTNPDGSTTQPLPVDVVVRKELLDSLPENAVVRNVRGASFTKIGPGRWMDASTGFREDTDVVMRITRQGEGWSVETPAPAPAAPADVIHADLPVDTFLPKADGSTAGLKRVGPDKWEMIKNDGTPSGRFATDETVKMFQELIGTTPVLPIDPRFGNPLGFDPEVLGLPGGVSLGKFIEQGGRFNTLTPRQRKAISDAYDNFIKNLNTQLPAGYSADFEGNGVNFGTSGFNSKVAFYFNGRKITKPEYTYDNTTGMSAQRYIRASTDARTGRLVSSVEHALFTLPDEHQGSGVSNVFLKLSKQMYRQMGLDRITIHADISVGGYAWARGGFDFKDRYKMAEALQSWETRSQWNIPRGREQEWKDGMKEFLELKAKATPQAFQNKTAPLPIDFANIGRPDGPTTSEDTWFGKHMMMGSDWYGEFPLNSNAPSATVAPSQ